MTWSGDWEFEYTDNDLVLIDQCISAHLSSDCLVCGDDDLAVKRRGKGVRRIQVSDQDTDASSQASDDEMDSDDGSEYESDVKEQDDTDSSDGMSTDDQEELSAEDDNEVNETVGNNNTLFCYICEQDRSMDDFSAKSRHKNHPYCLRHTTSTFHNRNPFREKEIYPSYWPGDRYNGKVGVWNFKFF